MRQTIKQLSFIVVLSLLSQPALAEVQIGLQLGFSPSPIKSDSEFETESSTSAEALGFLLWRVHSEYGFRLGLSYATTELDDENDAPILADIYIDRNNGTDTSGYQINSLEAHQLNERKWGLMLDYLLSDSGSFKPYARINYTLSGQYRAKLRERVYTDGSGLDADATWSVKGTRLSLGFDYQISTWILLGAEVNYSEEKLTQTGSHIGNPIGSGDFILGKAKMSGVGLMLSISSLIRPK